jgi:hypothetical protein
MWLKLCKKIVEVEGESVANRGEEQREALRVADVEGRDSPP